MSRSFRGDHVVLGMPPTYAGPWAVSTATEMVQQGGRVSVSRSQNCVGVFGDSLQHLDCVDRGQNKQFDFVTSGLALYFLHHGQSTVGTTDR